MRTLVQFLGCCAMVLLIGCSSLQRQAEEAKAFSNCEFKLDSVGNIRLVNISIQDKKSLKDLGAMDAVHILGEVARTKAFPVSFTLYLAVHNPNAKKAAMNRLELKFLFDDAELLSGAIETHAEIPPNSVVIVPLDLTVDLVKALNDKNVDAMVNLAFNIAGQGKHPTHITLMARPSIEIGGHVVPFPGYLVVRSTEFKSE